MVTRWVTRQSSHSFVLGGFQHKQEPGQSSQPALLPHPHRPFPRGTTPEGSSALGSAAPPPTLPCTPAGAAGSVFTCAETSAAATAATCILSAHTRSAPLTMPARTWPQGLPHKCCRGALPSVGRAAVLSGCLCLPTKVRLAKSSGRVWCSHSGGDHYLSSESSTDQSGGSKTNARNN